MFIGNERCGPGDFHKQDVVYGFITTGVHGLENVEVPIAMTVVMDPP